MRNGYSKYEASMKNVRQEKKKYEKGTKNLSHKTM